MLTVFALLAVLAILIGTAALLSNAAGGCFWSNVFLWLHLGDLIEAIGQLVGFVAASLTSDE